MTGMALYVPEVIMKRAPYSTCLLWWTFMRIAKPAMATQMLNMAKRNRWRTLSDTAAVNILHPNAAAQGGTE